MSIRGTRGLRESEAATNGLSRSLPQKREAASSSAGKESQKEVRCLECDAKITLPPDVIKGEILGCKECSSSFEVADIEKGVSIKPAEIPGEDWGE